jgi:hypothetical protein
MIHEKTFVLNKCEMCSFIVREERTQADGIRKQGADVDDGSMRSRSLILKGRSVIWAGHVAI